MNIIIIVEVLQYILMFEMSGIFSQKMVRPKTPSHVCSEVVCIEASDSVVVYQCITCEQKFQEEQTQSNPDLEVIFFCFIVMYKIMHSTYQRSFI